MRLPAIAGVIGTRLTLYRVREQDGRIARLEGRFQHTRERNDSVAGNKNGTQLSNEQYGLRFNYLVDVLLIPSQLSDHAAGFYSGAFVSVDTSFHALPRG